MKLLTALVFVPVMSHAATLFDGYEAYYASLPNQLFHDKGKALQPYSLASDDLVRHQWQGNAAGRKQRIELHDGQLTINGRLLKTKDITVFPDEVVSNTDLGAGTSVYFSPGWLCAENTPASASGTAVRHKSVYLIKQTGRRLQGWKLPSLFASCAAIRTQNKTITFYKVTYRYLDGQDEPQGADFKEFAIRGDTFVATGGAQSSTFVETGNVYKFFVAGE